LKARIAAAGVFLAGYLLFLRSAAPGVSLEDSGEMIACAVTLGVSHPPGGPGHALLGRLLLLLPFGVPAFRLNVLSAACGAFGVLAAWRLGASLPAAPGGPRRLGGFAAAAVFAGSSAVWWQAGVAGKYILAAALVAWALVALRRALEPDGRRQFLIAAGLFGISLGVHRMGLYLVPLLAWGWWRPGAAPVSRGLRAAALVAFLIAVPVGAKALYVPIRAHAAATWGMPDRAGRFIAYQSARRYVRQFLLRDASFGGLAGAALQQVFVLPWHETGPIVLVALLGAWVAWHRDRRVALLVAGLFVSNAAFGVVYQNPEVERSYLPACLALAVFAGAGVDWLGTMWRWVPAGCAAIWLVHAAAVAPFAMRDRDTIAPDHVRNLLLFVRPGDLVVAWGDSWLFPLQHARVVEGLAAAARVETAEVLQFGSPEREELARSGGSPRPLAGGATGPALVWELRRAAAREGAEVYLSQEAPPATIPSRGARWRGLLIRATAPGEPFGLDEAGTRWMRGLRLHSLLGAHGIFEGILVQYYAYALNARAQLLLRAGRVSEAERVIRLGLRLKPDLPELRQNLGRALMLEGRSDEAATEWRRAITLTRGSYTDPYIGLASVMKLRGDAMAVDEELEMQRTAAALAAPGGGERSSPVKEGDEARARGDPAAARAAYRKAIAIGLVTRGLAHFSAGRLPQAGAAWEEALVYDPAQSQAMHDLGTLAALEERFTDALGWYRAALRAGPRTQEMQDNMEKAAEAAAWQPKVAGLEAAAIRSGRENASALVLAGNARWYVGRSAAAEASYRRALRLEPGNVRALTNLGSALVQQGRVLESIPLYERAVGVSPRYAEAMVNLAAVYLGLGDRRRAEEWLARALELNPRDPRALEVKRGLGR